MSLGDAFQGWRILAHVGRPYYQPRLDRQSTAILARGVNASDQMLKSPTDFTLIWEDRASGAAAYGSVWRPIPPEGYVSLGDVFVEGWDKPNRNSYVCVRKTPVGGRSYVREAVIGSSIWDDGGSGAHMSVGMWAIDAPQYPHDSTERLILGLDGFVAGQHPTDKPSRAVYVLDLPAVIVKNNGPQLPVMTSHSVPEQETLKVIDRAVTVPCTVIKDPSQTPDWQATNSPFYTLERRVNYCRQMFYNNSQGTTQQDNSRAVTTGVSKTKGEEFSERTSISVTASAGIGIKAFSASAETSVTVEMGYTSRSEVTTFKEEQHTWAMSTPPRSSTALWSPRHEIMAIRKNGDVVGQGGLPFDLNEHVLTEFPGASGATVLIDGVKKEQDPKARPFGVPESNIPEHLKGTIAS
ncbi:Vps62-related protein [Streptomyces sp. RPA4-5]|uniref:Vps62-related protein n=3 Tax=unclassified Streptomyces TaxID=2593676 RepID=UPI00143E3D35|nr:Vps62-related protein [Streptomyces sp. RPA4-5]QIY58343.1 Vps62-related protein [Streptomyces sp. RPA4-5]